MAADFDPNQFVQGQGAAPGVSQGFDPASFAHEELTQEKYGTPEQQGKAALEGAAKGLAGPLATAAETHLLGVAPEDIAGREEANPITHYGSEAAGLIGGTFIPGSQANVLGTVGKGVSEGLGLAGAAGTAASLGVENALYAVGDETSKALLNNPASIQTAAAHVGLSGLLGAGLGAGLGKVGELWKAKMGPEAGQFMQDFSGRLRSIEDGTVATPEAVHEELSNEFGSIEAAKSDLRGPEGLKSHELSHILPQEMSPNMGEQASGVLRASEDLLDKAAAEPGIYQGARLPALRDYGARLAQSLSDPELTPQKVFTALDDFKKGVGSLKKWDMSMGEVEKPGAGLIGDLYNTVRQGLEDSSVWGKAGERQEAINKLWVEHLPAAKDFGRTFTEKLGNEPQVSAGKVGTLMNGLGKSNADIKLDKLSSYIESNDKIYDQLDKIHSNLDIENPYKRPDLTNVKSILGNLSPGMKAADFIHKQAANAAAEALGGGLGATLGHMSGVPGGGYLGGLFGHYAIKPFMRTIMPTLIKPLLKVAPSAEGMKAAIEGITAVSKGEALLNDSAKALFEVGSKAEINDLIPDKDQLDKLENSLTHMTGRPEAMLDVGGSLSHYMPEHATALAATTQAAVSYINSQKPKEVQPGVLDRPVAPSAMEEANYKSALSIAESPLMVLALVHKGMLQPNHVQHLQSLYPALAPSIVHSVTDHMLQHLSKDGVVPFKMRGSLGMLIGQPMDSTFSQPSMASAQATFTPPQPPQGASGVKKGTSKLGKSAELAQSPSDARQKALNKA